MQFNLNALLRPNVRLLKPYTSAREEFKDFGGTYIFLDANESPYPNGVNRYPDPTQSALKKRLASQRGISASNMLLGNGSDEILDLLFRAFCRPGKDEVILLPPTYGMYGVLANLNDIACKEIPLDDTFDLSVQAIQNAITSDTKLVFICSPNNPTGNLMSEEKIHRLLTSFYGLVVIDEAYINFAETPSWMTKLNQYPNLVVIQTLSKAYGMAGIRLGICYAGVEIIEVLNRIKPPYNINILTQESAMDALRNNTEVSVQVATMISQRDVLSKFIKTLPFVVKVYPSDANFILVKVDDADVRYQQLLERGVVVRNRTRELGCKNTLRISVGTPEEDRQFCEVLKTLDQAVKVK